MGVLNHGDEHSAHSQTVLVFEPSLPHQPEGRTQGSFDRCILKTSPRTQCLHVTKNLRRLGRIPIVGRKRCRLGP